MIVRLGRDVRAERQKSGFVRILGGGAEDGAERCGEGRRDIPLIYSIIIHKMRAKGQLFFDIRKLTGIFFLGGLKRVVNEENTA